MSNPIVFENGSLIEWVDRESLRYTNGDFSVVLWVDYEPGFFNSGRILRTSMLKNWDKRPERHQAIIDAKWKDEIVEKVEKYFALQKVKCRVAE